LIVQQGEGAQGDVEALLLHQPAGRQDELAVGRRA
jgi:hypothetical protein